MKEKIDKRQMIIRIFTLAFFIIETAILILILVFCAKYSVDDLHQGSQEIEEWNKYMKIRGWA